MSRRERRIKNQNLKTNNIPSRQFSSIFDRINEAIVIFDRQFKIVYHNNSAAQFFKLNLKEEKLAQDSNLGNQIQAIIASDPEEDYSRCKKETGRVHLLTGKSGDEIWVKTTLFPINYGSGRKVGVGVIIQDVTDEKKKQDERKYDLALKKEAEVALDKSRDQVQMLLEFVHDPFFLLDSELRFIYVNKSTEEVFGKRSYELLGHQIQRILPDMITTEFYRRLLAGNTYSFREFFAPLGIWIDCSIYTWKYNDSYNIGVHFKDVSENVMLEKELCQSEENYRQLIGSICDPFFALDRRLRVTYWNENAAKLTKIKANEALFKHIRELFPKTEEQDFDAILMDAIADQKPRRLSLKLPSDGVERLFEVYIYPSAKGLSVLLRDVTETLRLEAELKKYNQQLQRLVEERTRELKDAERLATIGQTAGMVGHDIRNPLQTITSSLYLAGEETKTIPDKETREQLNESLQTIEEQVTYINKIITDLQDFARRLTPVIEEISIEEILKTALSTISAPEAVRIFSSVEPKIPEMKTDKSFITRILTNLINNAIQAMPNGGQIKLNAAYKNQMVTLIVEDTGLGIPEEAKPKLFTPLFTTKAKGQGFGLPVVKRLTEALGGTVTFETQMGKGTKFTVEIPVNSEDKPA